MKKKFTALLLDWNKRFNKRIMPWKGEKDPFKIWLSEIILQQTRVEQGLLYYEKFVKAFSDIHQLANALDAEVFKLWEGLGYYSRCKNLLFTARHISSKMSGIFPTNYSHLLQLKGVGPYTAAAIASFAYNLPHAVVDGNVYRVLSRFFGIDVPIDSNDGRKLFNDLAHECLDLKDTAAYNQAIMDFGATVCKPQIPLCNTCILKNHCKAVKNGWVNELPVKEKQLQKAKRYLYYFVFTCNKQVLVNQRMGKGIWENLYEFYLYETPREVHWNNEMVQKWLNHQLGVSVFGRLKISTVVKQHLTHQSLRGQFITVELEKIPKSLQHLLKVDIKNIYELAFPKFIHHFFLETDAFTQSN